MTKEQVFSLLREREGDDFIAYYRDRMGMDILRINAGGRFLDALKGVTGNLALTPLYDPICKITELLRSRTETDYTGYLRTILEKKDELAGMI